MLNKSILCVSRFQAQIALSVLRSVGEKWERKKPVLTIGPFCVLVVLVNLDFVSGLCSFGSALGTDSYTKTAPFYLQLEYSFQTFI